MWFTGEASPASSAFSPSVRPNSTVSRPASAEIRYRHIAPVQSEGAVPLTPVRPRRVPEIYRLEAFASTDPALATHGVTFVKFDLAPGTAGIIPVTLDDRTPLTFGDGKLTNEKGELLAAFDAAWKGERQRATAKLTTTRGATFALATQPLPASVALLPDYAAQRATCVATWRPLLAAGMPVVTPAPLVNDAWRHLVVQNFELIFGDRMHYSAGNQSNQLDEAEGSDAALALMTWGYAHDTRRLLEPLLDFTRKGLEQHQAGFTLADVCHDYWQTRDATPCARSARSGKKPRASSSSPAPAGTVSSRPSATPATSTPPPYR